MKNYLKNLIIPSLLSFGVYLLFYSISLSSNPSRFNESSSYFNKIGNKYIKDDDLIVLLNKNSNKEDLFK